MKIPFTICDLRFTPRIRRSRGGHGGSRPMASPSPGGPNERSECYFVCCSNSNEQSECRFICSSDVGRGEGELNCSSGRKSALTASTLQRFNASTWQPFAPSREKNSRQSYIVNRKSQEGVALIITLILLSVTLVMAVAFLAVSRRERGSVSTESDSTTAKLAADAALAQAEAQLVSGFLAETNPYISSLLVSTNYINGYGFNPNVVGVNPTNVNYDSYPVPPNGAGGPLSLADMQQNIANLFYLPRPPVYATNYMFGYEELQFYLDLNRNGRFDTNGIVRDLNDLGTTNGLGTYSLQVGDPEWIGVLEHPDAPHSANNPFIARYAFIAVPADSLDLNSIHNQALDVDVSRGNTIVYPTTLGYDAYSRNQGVGTWEINLAAFLADLDTNRWDPPTRLNALLEPYSYPQPNYLSSIAFDDARSLVSWRYNDYYPSLANAIGTFSDPVAFVNNNADDYSLGQQVTFDTNYAGYGNTAWPWLGANNTNNFFSSPAELFNPNKSWPSFTNNLVAAGTNLSTYDRYTYYRLLGQLGTDTSPEAGKVNLNYANAIVTYDTTIPGLPLPLSIGVVPGMETNLIPWAPLDFFNAAADKLLHAYSAEWFQSNPTNFYETYYGQVPQNQVYLSGQGVINLPYLGPTNQIPAFGITNIPVYVNGQFVYSSAVNRLLQLAANIYDAQTNAVNLSLGLSNYPSVFRPVFWVTNQFNPYANQTFRDVYIRGFQCIQSPNNFVNQIPPSTPPAFTTPVEVNSLPLGINVSNVWGIPMIIGAKKGLPNFNAFETVNNFFVERKLQFNRNTTDSSGRFYTTNQMYIMGISNYLGVEDWNSYASNYNNQVTIQANTYLTVLMTETNGGVGSVPVPFSNYQVPMLMYGTTNMTTWSGYLNRPPNDPSFIFPLMTNTMWLTNSVFYYGTGGPNNLGYPANSFIPVFLDPSNYLDNGTPPLPQFNLLITNRLQAYILDSHLGNTEPVILDYVQVGGMDDNLNVNQAIADPDNTGMWSTNFYNSYNGGGATPFGVNEQYLVSRGGTFPAADNDGGNWSTGPAGAGADVSPAAQQAFFSAFFSAQNMAPYGAGYVSNFDLSVQAPYTPIRYINQRFVYEANDPLVHYLASDLNDYNEDTNGSHVLDNPPLKFIIGAVNDRYMPWGSGNTLQGQTYKAYGNSFLADGNKFNLSYKDPLVFASDNWDFPTNKYPTVGWLGRVHRGTPWQTVYLKSSNILALATGGVYGEGTWPLWTGDYNGYDATNSAPVQDRLLFDLFTVAPDEAAMRGQLNVNVDAYDVQNTNAPYDPLSGLASWSALLSGAIAFSNDLSGARANGPFYAQRPLGRYSWPLYSLWTNSPAGVNPVNSALGQIVTAINDARTNYVGIDGLRGAFEHAGDVLSAAQLAEQSPFLNWSNSDQQQYDISDEMYEWLPQQIMSLVTVSGTPQSPPRYVIYCYGQTLKPAPDGIVTSGTFFGLCTNYQVVSESASRAIIRVVNAPTPGNPTAAPHIVLEQYNPLPPD